MHLNMGAFGGLTRGGRDHTRHLGSALTFQTSISLVMARYHGTSFVASGSLATARRSTSGQGRFFEISPTVGACRGKLMWGMDLGERGADLLRLVRPGDRSLGIILCGGGRVCYNAAPRPQQALLLSPSAVLMGHSGTGGGRGSRRHQSNRGEHSERANFKKFWYGIAGALGIVYAWVGLMYWKQRQYMKSISLPEVMDPPDGFSHEFVHPYHKVERST